MWCEEWINKPLNMFNVLPTGKHYWWVRRVDFDICDEVKWPPPVKITSHQWINARPHSAIITKVSFLWKWSVSACWKWKSNNGNHRLANWLWSHFMQKVSGAFLKLKIRILQPLMGVFSLLWTLTYKFMVCCRCVIKYKWSMGIKAKMTCFLAMRKILAEPVLCH